MNTSIPTQGICFSVLNVLKNCRTCGPRLWGKRDHKTVTEKEYPMKRLLASLTLALFVLGALAPGANAGKWTAGMKIGDPALKSIGPLAFGPDGILFVADTK